MAACAAGGGGGGGASGARINCGHAAVVRILLAAGADADEAAGLPLCLAAAAGRADVVRVLLDGGANTAALDGQALVLASHRGHLNLFSLSLHNSGPRNSSYSRSNGGCVPGGARALELAARNGHSAMVMELLAAGVPAMAAGGRAISAAIQSGRTALGEALLKRALGGEEGRQAGVGGSSEVEQ
ncbi:hypothetical protein PLESTM_001740100 [Pleodorina starrii]|nr:hypothetical protein PLESTM_001740100 [Pleodorina starrii]